MFHLCYGIARDVYSDLTPNQSPGWLAGGFSSGICQPFYALYSRIPAAFSSVAVTSALTGR
jgi:hypothetical protein